MTKLEQMRKQHEVADKLKAERALKRQSVIYVYATPENKHFVKWLSTKYNISESEVMNTMIAAVRERKKLSLKVVIPKFVQKAEEWTKQRRASKKEH